MLLRKLAGRPGARVPQALIIIGMGCLVVALLSLKLFHASGGSNTIDLARGALFGVAIGNTLLGVILAARHARRF